MMANEELLLPDAPVLDTYFIARHIVPYYMSESIDSVTERLKIPGQYSLGSLLSGVGITGRRTLLHDADIDSHLTMRLLLMLAVRSLAKTSHALKNEPRLSVLQSIASVPMAKHPRYDSQVFDQSEIDAMRARQFHGLRFGVKSVKTALSLLKEMALP